MQLCKQMYARLYLVFAVLEQASNKNNQQTFETHQVFLLSIRKLSANVGPVSISIVAVILVTCSLFVLDN